MDNTCYIWGSLFWDIMGHRIFVPQDLGERAVIFLGEILQVQRGVEYYLFANSNIFYVCLNPRNMKFT